MSRPRITSKTLVNKVFNDCKDVINLQEDVILLIVSRYLHLKSEYLQKGFIVDEPEGESMMTARRTNSEKNSGYSTKIVTNLSPDLNKKFCDKFVTDNSLFENFRK